MTENLVGDEYRTVGRTYQVWALFEAGRGLAREVKTLGPLATAEEQIVLAQRGFVLKKSFCYQGIFSGATGKDKQGKPKHHGNPNIWAQIRAYLYARKLLGLRESKEGGTFFAWLAGLWPFGKK